MTFMLTLNFDHDIFQRYCKNVNPTTATIQEASGNWELSGEVVLLKQCYLVRESNLSCHDWN